MRAVLELFQEAGATEFRLGDLEVKFGGTRIPVEIEDDPEVAKKKELEDITRRLEQINQTTAEDELWST